MGLFCSGLRTSTLVTIAALLWSAALNAKPMTLQDFRSHQETYCNILVQHLNRPVHWHIAIDSSRSFQFAASTKRTEQVINTIRTLPMTEGDALTIHFFSTISSEGLTEGRINFDAWQKIPISHNRIQGLLLEADTSHPANSTDFFELIDSLPEAVPTNSAFINYVVIITDGLQQPDGPGQHQQLFLASGNRKGEFLRALNANNSRNYILHFIIDARGNSQEDIVTSDWTQGQEDVRDSSEVDTTSLEGILFDFTPVITLVHYDDAVFDVRIAAQDHLRRYRGIAPCFISAAPIDGEYFLATTQQWPGINGMRHPKCSAALSGSRETLCDHSMTAVTAILEQRSQIRLPLGFIVRGSENRTVEFKARAGEESSTPFIIQPLTFSSKPEDLEYQQKWTTEWREILLDLQENERAKYPFPWHVEAWSAGSSLPFLKLEITDSPIYFPTDQVSQLWHFLRFRGRGLALLALFLAIAASVLNLYNLNQTKVSIKIKNASEETESMPALWRDMHVACRVRHHVPLANSASNGRTAQEGEEAGSEATVEGNATSRVTEIKTRMRKLGPSIGTKDSSPWLKC